MIFSVSPSSLNGTVDIPGSKSHTIRAVLLAAISEGKSTLLAPLSSSDTESAVKVYTALGAKVEQGEKEWIIEGLGKDFKAPTVPLDVGNSGTTMRVAMGSLSLLKEGYAEISGDHQIQARPSQPLADALTELGAKVVSINNNNCPPYRIEGRLSGGKIKIECKTSQYLSSLLLACPLADEDSEITIPLLYEKPYVSITLDWLKFMGIKLEYKDDFSYFKIPGRQNFKAFTRRIPADFSTATFFLCAGVLSGNEVTSCGLDLEDTQPDKAVVEYLRRMGAEISIHGDKITTKASKLQGIEIDMNETPDALPMMAVIGCFAEGETRLVNVPQARIKETDRIAVMCQELTDGLIIRKSDLKGASVEGHHDHRVVMSLAIAASQAKGDTSITTAEAAAVTAPEFEQMMQSLGAKITPQNI